MNSIDRAAAAADRVTFVVIDDNELDVEKFERSMKQLRIRNPVVTARDGIEGLEVLRGAEGRGPLPPPFIVLLDINMPRMNGFEMLAELREDPELRDTLVFVLTTSERKADMEAADRFQVAGYMVKPLDRRGLLEALKLLEADWELSLPVNTEACDSR